jgi:hypothetical protein
LGYRAAAKPQPRRDAARCPAKETVMDKVSTWLWSDYKAEETAAFYTGLVPDSRIVEVARAQSDNP